jgi:hypothetical protein
MKFRITVLNKPELVARFILEALEVADLLECRITIHFRREPGKKGVGLNFLPPGKGAGFRIGNRRFGQRPPSSFRGVASLDVPPHGGQRLPPLQLALKLCKRLKRKVKKGKENEKDNNSIDAFKFIGGGNGDERLRRQKNRGQ